MYVQRTFGDIRYVMLLQYWLTLIHDCMLSYSCTNQQFYSCLLSLIQLPKLMISCHCLLNVQSFFYNTKLGLMFCCSIINYNFQIRKELIPIFIQIWILIINKVYIAIKIFVCILCNSFFGTTHSIQVFGDKEHGVNQSMIWAKFICKILRLN